MYWWSGGVYWWSVLVVCSGWWTKLVDRTGGGLYWWTVDPLVDVWDVVRVGASDSRRYLLYGSYLGRRDESHETGHLDVLHGGSS